jgi:hypothetical protein
MTEKESTEKKIRNIRRQNRKKYSAEEKIRLVLEGLRGDESIAELCRREGLSQTMRLSVASDGTQSNGHSVSSSISGDGRFVVFESTATNLVSGDTNNAADVFVHDLQTKQTTRVSVASDGMQGNNFSGIGQLSSPPMDDILHSYRELVI